MFFVYLFTTTAFASSCENIDTKMTEKVKKDYATAIAKQLKVKSVEVLKIFRKENWRIIYISTDGSDDPFVFYSDDPTTTKYITLWSGAAKKEEENDIKKWAYKNVPGIPSELADCFSWHVTHNREM